MHGSFAARCPLQAPQAVQGFMARGRELAAERDRAAEEVVWVPVKVCLLPRLGITCQPAITF